jgi:hypothetical protein
MPLVTVPTAWRFEMKWYTVTWRGTAEMVVCVLANTPEDACQRAEDGYYEEVSEIEFLNGEPFTTKVRVAEPDEVAAVREP